MEVDRRTQDHSAATPQMNKYWRTFRTRTYITITAAQTGLILIIMVALQQIGIIHTSFGVFLAIAAVVAATHNVVTLVIFHLISRPFHDLVQAVVLIAGEPGHGVAPSPNLHHYDEDGFKEILQTVYELAAKATAPPKKPEQTDSTLVEGLKNTSTGIVIFNDKRQIVYHNQHAPVGKNIKDEDILQLLFPEDDTLEKWLERCQKNKLASEHVWTRVANRLPGENDRRLYDVVASYHKNSPAETVLTLFDRTNAYKPEEDDLDFISFAAHELRGPITVIRGYLDVLEEELGPMMEADQAELMQRLIVAANRLTSYVNNILNASRYDRRHLSLHLSEETVGRIYEGIADDMQLRASTQNRLLAIDIPDALPTVAADAAAVGEVLSNLIDNAIKYSNEGGLVHVTAHTIQGFVEISITDRGIGMPSNVLPNLFHKFYRSHRSRETVAGTGIGLYICKAIVSSHGGTLDVRSVENEGSTFSFTLPIYDTVADKLLADHNMNKSLIEHGSGWIRNHSMYRG